jgi:hypothetical protein
MLVRTVRASLDAILRVVVSFAPLCDAVSCYGRVCTTNVSVWAGLSRIPVRLNSRPAKLSPRKHSCRANITIRLSRFLINLHVALLRRPVICTIVSYAAVQGLLMKGPTACHCLLGPRGRIQLAIRGFPEVLGALGTIRWS